MVRHILAGAAGAGGVELYLPQRISKHEIQILQGFQQGLRLDEVFLRDVHEDGISAKAGDHEGMLDVRKLHIEQAL